MEEMEEINFPGPELLLQWEKLLSYDLMLQLIIFTSYILLLILVSLTIRQWGVMRKVTYLVPESVILLVLGCLLGLAGNLIYNQKINCLLPR